MQNSLLTRRYFITGSQRLSNFFWASLISFGGAGFLITGFFSFLNRNGGANQTFSDPSVYDVLGKENFGVPPAGGLGLDVWSVASPPSFPEINSIRVFPQGLIMCFYGCLGLLFGIYLWLTIIWKVGSGFNEFNKNTGVVRIFRWGLPGKNRQIDFQYKVKDIEALRVSLKEGINPRRTIALQIKGKGEIPLTRIGEPMPLQDIENQASSLASFLKVEIQVES